MASNLTHNHMPAPSNDPQDPTLSLSLWPHCPSLPPHLPLFKHSAPVALNGAVLFPQMHPGFAFSSHAGFWASPQSWRASSAILPHAGTLACTSLHILARLYFSLYRLLSRLCVIYPGHLCIFFFPSSLERQRKHMNRYGLESSRFDERHETSSLGDSHGVRQNTHTS